MGGYALGGRFTTLEGLLNNVLEQVENNPMMGAALGDSSRDEQKQKIIQFQDKLKELMQVKQSFTIILDDPAGNSYIQVSKNWWLSSEKYWSFLHFRTPTLPILTPKWLLKTMKEALTKTKNWAWMTWIQKIIYPQVSLYNSGPIHLKDEAVAPNHNYSWILDKPANTSLRETLLVALAKHHPLSNPPERVRWGVKSTQHHRWWPMERDRPRLTRHQNNDNSFRGCYFSPFSSFSWLLGLTCFAPWIMNAGLSMEIPPPFSKAVAAVQSPESRDQICTQNPAMTILYQKFCDEIVLLQPCIPFYSFRKIATTWSSLFFWVLFSFATQTHPSHFY